MKIISWNVAGVRAILKKGKLEEMILKENPDILCLQETKAEEDQVIIPESINKIYPYRFQTI